MAELIGIVLGIFIVTAIAALAISIWYVKQCREDRNKAVAKSLQLEFHNAEMRRFMIDVVKAKAVVCDEKLFIKEAAVPSFADYQLGDFAKDE